MTDPSSLQRPHASIILASASSSRLALLQAAGLSVTVRKPSVDEDVLKRQAKAKGMQAADAALMLAERKAGSVSGQPGINPDALVIGADQLLVCDGRWYDKPVDLADARTQLKALSGRTHLLHTAVACCRHGTTVWRHVAAPVLSMRRLTDAFLDAYLSVEADHVLHCVGAYRLEGPGIHLFDAVEGEHAAILGLPLLALLGFLRQQDILVG
ncbi:Maf family protein [Lichenicola cladoniae]|uniref:Maf family protein n=1 Tax=Lichenicola cladoniae TaxID=1484109 RepID=UPI001EF51B5E|nr:nucleoside triphosphate pyrophosphatase [Lichenicola cladoniae]